MAGRQSLDILFNIVIFLVNFLNFTSTAPHTQPQKRISSSKANSHSSCPPPAPNSSATSPSSSTVRPPSTTWQPQ